MTRTMNAQKPEVLMKFLREYQPRTEPSQATKKVENSQPVIQAAVAKPEVSKNDLERLEDGFNSQVKLSNSQLKRTLQIQKILARLDKVEGENKILAKENNFLKKEVEDVNATLKDEYERFSKEIKSLNSTVRTQNGTIEDLKARIAVLESSQVLKIVERPRCISLFFCSSARADEVPVSGIFIADKAARARRHFYEQFLALFSQFSKLIQEIFLF
jgi:chromosome segregation ATPase